MRVYFFEDVDVLIVNIGVLIVVREYPFSCVKLLLLKTVSRISQSILTCYEKYSSVWERNIYIYMEHNFFYLEIYMNVIYYKIENFSKFVFEFYRIENQM